MMIILDSIPGQWTFDLTQYDSVWKLIINLTLLLTALLLGNLIRRVTPFLRKAFIPSALIGGILLFLVNLFFSKVCNYDLIDMRIMQIVTYHALGIGFIAMSLKIMDNGKEKIKGIQVVQNGLVTGGTYMLQAVVGLLIGLFFFWAGSGLFYDAGVILPLGFGQGPGNALTWDLKFSEYGFDGQGSFGLTIASIGFVVASIVGVIYINIYKRKGQIKERDNVSTRQLTDFESNNEIEDSESVDKSTIQYAFVGLCYGLAFLVMFFFSKLTDWTGIKLFNDVAWGFNFIWGVITATLVKMGLKLLKKKKIIKKKYINNYQMDRISGFAFDVMIIAGVAAIDINVVSKYIWVIVALCVAGAIVTTIYVRFMTKLCFKGFEHEAFLVNFGTLTGTASNGMILLREVDPSYETPTSNIFVVSQFPAMIAVAPILLLLTTGAKSEAGCYTTLGIFAGLFIAYTTFLVLSVKLKRKKENVANQ